MGLTADNRDWVRRQIDKKLNHFEDRLDISLVDLYSRIDGLLSRVEVLEEQVEELENGGTLPPPPESDEFPYAVAQIVYGPERWHGPHPLSQTVVPQIANASISSLNGRISWEWLVEPEWPQDADGIGGNIHIVAKVDGKWTTASWEWLRAWQDAKFVQFGDYGDHIKQGPLADWEPQFGEELYIYATPQQRAGQYTTPFYVPERTNITRVRWV